MSTADNKAKARRFFEEVWNQGNLAVVDELVAATFVDHGLFPPVQGLEALKHYVEMYRTAFPDMHFTIEDLISEGDTVVARYTGTGTHQGTLLGVPPTGKAVIVTGINITCYENGKVVEGWNNFDTLGMLQQIGAIPTPG